MPRSEHLAGPRRLGAAIAAVAVIAATLVLGLATPASADSTLTLTGAGNGGAIDGSWPGGAGTYYAGTLLGDIAGTPVVTYCLDIGTEISDGDVVEESTWADVAMPNLATVASILAGYDASDPSSDPTGYELVGNTNLRAASIQSAIWAFTNEFVPSSPADLVTNHATILAAVADGVLPVVGEAAPSLEIAPSTLGGAAGDVVGPFAVDTTAATVELTAVDGDLVTWPAGDPLASPVPDGTQFGVRSLLEGTATISASGSAVIEQNRVFRADDIQPLIVADAATATATAQATATFGPFQGSITLQKSVEGAVNADGSPRPTSFTFDIAGPDGFTDSVTLPVGDSWSHTWTGLGAGEYTITERDAGDPAAAPSGVPATVTLAPGTNPTATVTAVNTYFGGPQPTALASASCDAGLEATVSNSGDLPATVQVTHTTGAGVETTFDLEVPAGADGLAVSLPDTAVSVVISYGEAILAQASAPTDCVVPPEVGGIDTTPRQTPPSTTTTTPPASTGSTTLPRTGSSTTDLVVPALVLLATGALLVTAGRHPEPSTELAE